MKHGSHHSYLRTCIQTIRVPFLLLTLVCVFLGVATAVASGYNISSVDIGLVLTGALGAHISVNVFNEYLDCKSGLDALTTRTPFSGGSGALVQRPDALGGALYLAIGALTVTLLTGLYFVFSGALLLLPIGAVGIAIVLTYTPWLNRLPWLCLLAPGLAFGPLMVVGTHVALTGEYTALVLLASLLPFFLTNNLLLLNQYPDMSPDRSAGRKTFPVVYGIHNSSRVYGLFLFLAGLTVLAGMWLELLPVLSSVCLVALIGGLPAVTGATKYAQSAIRITPFLAVNVAVALLTPLLLGLSVLIAWKPGSGLMH